MNRTLPKPAGDVALLVARLLLGTIMFAHGYQKLVVSGLVEAEVVPPGQLAKVAAELLLLQRDVHDWGWAGVEGAPRGGMAGSRGG